MKYLEGERQMANVTTKLNDKHLTIALDGHIDSKNAPEVEAEIQTHLTDDDLHITIDAENLQYISSAGLRIILRLKKKYPDVSIVNVSNDVYEVFDMTGFTEMMEVKKAYRVLSVEGCEVIGQGANGKVYRIDPDTIVKVYYNPDSLPEIHRERELARAAFVLGIPTAIPYDVVRVGEGYGSVFELLNAKSFAKLLASGEKSPDEIAEMSVDLLKQIHSTVVKPDMMPDERAVVIDWAEFLQPYLPEDAYNKLHQLVEAVPVDYHMLHGDYHIKNVMLQNGESLLIDMDTLCHGHPVFELASMYNAYCGFSELNHKNVEEFLGIPHEMSVYLWKKMLELYLEGKSKEEIKLVEMKAMLLGYTRIMRRAIRRNGFDTEEGRLQIENAKKHILEILPQIDTLLF